MARTTTRPPDDPKMWRRLVARTRPRLAWGIRPVPSEERRKHD